MWAHPPLGRPLELVSLLERSQSPAPALGCATSWTSEASCPLLPLSTEHALPPSSLHQIPADAPPRLFDCSVVIFKVPGVTLTSWATSRDIMGSAFAPFAWRIPAVKCFSTATLNFGWTCHRRRQATRRRRRHGPNLCGVAHAGAGGDTARITSASARDGDTSTFSKALEIPVGISFTRAFIKHTMHLMPRAGDQFSVSGCCCHSKGGVEERSPPPTVSSVWVVAVSGAGRSFRPPAEFGLGARY